jgi:hypothetical protein
MLKNSGYGYIVWRNQFLWLLKRLQIRLREAEIKRVKNCTEMDGAITKM